MTVVAGTPLHLRPTVCGDGPLTFVWQRNGVLLGNAHGPELFVAQATDASAGLYELQVTGPNGVTASTSWAVTVAAASAYAGIYTSPVGTNGRATLRIGYDGSGSLVVFDPDSSQQFSAWDFAVGADGVIRFADADPPDGAIANGTATLTLPGFAPLSLSLEAANVGALVPGTYRGSPLGLAGDAVFIGDAAGTFVWTVHRADAAWSGSFSIVAPGDPFSSSTAGATLTGTVFADGRIRANLQLSATEAIAVHAALPGWTGFSELANLSTRGYLPPTDIPLIAGFSIVGGEPQEMLVRAIGPSLADYDVGAPAARVGVTLHDGIGTIDENDGWWRNPNAQQVFDLGTSLGAFPLAPFSGDSALAHELTPGLYTAVGQTPSGESGVALMELYDGGTASGAHRVSHTVNVSTRGFAGTGEQSLIAGFSIVGNAPMKLLVRGVGRGLDQYDVPNTAPDPHVTVYRAQTPLCANDDWDFGEQPPEDLLTAFAQTGAFVLEANSRDAAVVVFLDPGLYTAVVEDEHGGTALAEVYLIAP